MPSAAGESPESRKASLFALLALRPKSDSRLVLTLAIVCVYTCKCDGIVWASEKVSLECSTKSSFLARIMPRPGEDVSEVRIPFKGYCGYIEYDS